MRYKQHNKYDPTEGEGWRRRKDRGDVEHRERERRERERE